MGLEGSSFAPFQRFESRALNVYEPFKEALAEANWYVEVAPLTAPSPALPQAVERHRIAYRDARYVWPFVGELDSLPLDDDSIPLILLRHIWQMGQDHTPIDEWVRVLKPGGWLISIALNPWHPKIWQQLGRQSLQLPSWPHLLWAHQHPLLSMQKSQRLVRQWSLSWSPVLVVGLRKHAPVVPLRRHPSKPLAVPPLATNAAQCRAA